MIPEISTRPKKVVGGYQQKVVLWVVVMDYPQLDIVLLQVFSLN